MPPLVAHAFWPLMTHSSAASSNLAVVRTPETSEPALGSEAQKAATFTSSWVPKQRGIHSPICSPVPCPKIAATASEVPMIDMPIPASPQNSSSLTIGSDRPARVARRTGPAPSKPYRPILAASWMIGQGVSSLLVPLVRGRAHDVGGEAVHPVADVLLVLVQLQRERPLPGWRRLRRLGGGLRCGASWSCADRGGPSGGRGIRVAVLTGIAPRCPHATDIRGVGCITYPASSGCQASSRLVSAKPSFGSFPARRRRPSPSRALCAGSSAAQSTPAAALRRSPHIRSPRGAGRGPHQRPLDRPDHLREVELGGGFRSQ